MDETKADLLLGYLATGLGTSAAALQWWGQLGNLLLIGLNVFLAIGGLYLISLRIRKARLELSIVARNKKTRV